MRFIELNLRVCPNALLIQTKAEYHHQLISEFSSVIVTTENLGLLSYFQHLTGATHAMTRGWLRYFSLKNCDLIEILGPVLWDSVVIPLWD